MQINHSNIEERLFDYFEGNLTEQEKVELMNFIHQNPDYERDFAAWAQSFAIQTEPVKNYKLEKLLIKKEKPFFYHKATYIIISVVLIVACGIFFFQETPQTIPVHKAAAGAVLQKSIPQAEAPTSIAGAKKATVAKTFTISKNESKNLDSTNTSLPILNNVAIDTTISIAEEIKTNNTLPKDTANAASLNKEPTDAGLNTKTNSEQKKKRKTKRPLNLAPSSDFLPINDNF